MPTKSATHLWSLAVEEQFYLLLAVGFALLSRTIGWRHALPWILIGLLIICPILRAMGPSLGYTPWDIYVLTHFRIDALAAGVLLAFLAAERAQLFERLLRQRAIWAVVAAVGATFLWQVYKNSPLGEVAGYSVSWITSAAVLLFLYRAQMPSPLCWPCLVIAFLGQISYPLYLWHVAVLKLGQRYLPRVIGDGNYALQTLLIYLGAIAVAFAVTELIERPIMRLRDRILPAPRKARA